MNGQAMGGATQQKGEFRAGWKILVAGLVGVACGASPVPFNVIGFAIDPIRQETGWSIAAISLGFTVFGVVASLLAPAYGWLSDRYGVRPVAIWSTVGFAASFACVGLIPTTHIGWFYGAWFLVGLVGIGSTPVTWSRAVNMWFRKSRGLALGVLLLGTSICALVVPRLAVAALEQWGWRGMFLSLSLLPLLVATPLALAWFREPRPEEIPSAAAGNELLSGMTLRQAMRDRRFWTLWLSISLVAIAYGGAHVHMPKIIAQHGMSTKDAAGVMGLIGVALMTGRIVTGWLFDRFWGAAGVLAHPVDPRPCLLDADRLQRQRGHRAQRRLHARLCGRGRSGCHRVPCQPLFRPCPLRQDLRHALYAVRHARGLIARALWLGEGHHRHL
jgi:OFA family oxalate/formate antiporter-like MFS transporter